MFQWYFIWYYLIFATHNAMAISIRWMNLTNNFKDALSFSFTIIMIFPEKWKKNIQIGSSFVSCFKLIIRDEINLNMTLFTSNTYDLYIKLIMRKNDYCYFNFLSFMKCIMYAFFEYSMFIAIVYKHINYICTFILSPFLTQKTRKGL